MVQYFLAGDRRNTSRASLFGSGLQPVFNLIRVETDAGLLTPDAQLNVRNIVHATPLIDSGSPYSTPLGNILCLPEWFNMGC